MKAKALMSCLFSLLVLGCQSKSYNKTEYSCGGNYTYLNISGNISKGDLLKIQNEFKQECNLSLNIDSTFFSKTGKVELLNVHFSTADGFKGHLKASKGFKSTGFSIDYRVNKKGCLSVYTVN